MPPSTSAQPPHPPVPTAILLRNAYVPTPDHTCSEEGDVPNPAMIEEDRSGKEGQRRRRRRNLKSSSAAGDHRTLPTPPSIRLELVVDRHVVTAEVQSRICGKAAIDSMNDASGLNSANLTLCDDDGQEDTTTAATATTPSDVILHSSSSPCPSLHPRWDHLDEKFHLFERKHSDTNGKNSTATLDAIKFDDVYKSIKARVVIDVPSSDLATETEETSRNTTPLVLVELPLYPTDLRRLPRSAANAGQTDGDDDDDYHLSSTPPAHTASVTIPSALPPNALLVHYSDGTTRIDPTLYHRLVKAGIINETKAKAGGRLRLDSGVIEDRIREDRKARRFDDDIFDMLGEGVGGGGSSSDGDAIIKEGTVESANSFRDDVFDLLGGGSAKDNTEGEREVKAQSEPKTASRPVDDAGIGQENGSSGNASPIPLAAANDQIDDLRSELESLRAVLAEEEQGLEKDRDDLANETQALSTLVERTKHLRKEVELINEDATDQERKQSETEFHLEARRAKLLRDLHLIYPIQCLPDNVYTIRGLHLPSDLHGPGVPDAVISAALGYVCHLVYMCSKYLCIPLRYRLFCNSSRSAVQDDGVAVYPLFRERVVEREQFDRAFTLLGRNVECLLRGRGIDFYHRSHILAKLERLFVQTNEIGNAIQ